jgi:hypothetical protein
MLASKSFALRLVKALNAYHGTTSPSMSSPNLPRPGVPFKSSSPGGVRPLTKSNGGEAQALIREVASALKKVGASATNANKYAAQAVESGETSFDAAFIAAVRLNGQGGASPASGPKHVN